MDSPSGQQLIRLMTPLMIISHVFSLEKPAVIEGLQTVGRSKRGTAASRSPDPLQNILYKNGGRGSYCTQLSKQQIYWADFKVIVHFIR